MINAKKDRKSTTTIQTKIIEIKKNHQQRTAKQQEQFINKSRKQGNRD